MKRPSDQACIWGWFIKNIHITSLKHHLHYTKDNWTFFCDQSSHLLETLYCYLWPSCIVPYLLSSWAATSHVQRCLSFDHDHPVVIDAAFCCCCWSLVIWPNLYRLNIWKQSNRYLQITNSDFLMCYFFTCQPFASWCRISRYAFYLFSNHLFYIIWRTGMRLILIVTMINAS